MNHEVLAVMVVGAGESMSGEQFKMVADVFVFHCLIPMAALFERQYLLAVGFTACAELLRYPAANNLAFFY